MKIPQIKQGSRYRPMAQMLRKALHEKGMTMVELSDALGFTIPQRTAVANWFAGRNGPTLEKRQRISEILDIMPNQWVAVTPVNLHDAKKANGDALGPAQRAVALVQVAKANGEVIAPTPPPSDVFTIRVRTDGSMQLRLDTTLPFAKGSELLRYLLGFGLVIGAEPEEPDHV